jgi:exodeoxyribonuclease VII small subunit
VKKKPAGDSEATLTFEEALERLEQIVAHLEEGQAGLSETLEKYEAGVKLVRQCHELLGQAERKIEILSGFDAEGNPVTTPLADAPAESLEQKAASRSRRRSQGRPAPSENTSADADDDGIPF